MTSTPATDPTDIETELDAMKEVARALAPLRPEQRSRVLDWASQFRAPLMRSLGSS